MVKHAMDVSVTIVNCYNSSQISIKATDLPIYAIEKQLQWKHPDQHGEDKLVWVLGELHSKMAAWSMVGRLLTDSGWTSMVSEADVST